jgi:excisionase family DNA binding protein
VNTKGRRRRRVEGDNTVEPRSIIERLAPSRSSEPIPLHDVPAIARRLNVSEKTVRRLIDRHELRAYRVGRLLRISEEELVRFISGQ